MKKKSKKTTKNESERIYEATLENFLNRIKNNSSFHLAVEGYNRESKYVREVLMWRRLFVKSLGKKSSEAASKLFYMTDPTVILDAKSPDKIYEICTKKQKRFERTKGDSSCLCSVLEDTLKKSLDELPKCP